jgi:hypothetical protein
VKEHRYGRGTVICGRSLREILRSRGIGPDFSFTRGNGPAANLDYIHRRAENADIYFVSNANTSCQEVACTFRVFGRTPELWDATTGQIAEQLVFESVEGGTKVPLRLPPAGAIFVVFRDKPKRTHIVAVSRNDTQTLPTSSGAAQELATLEILPGTHSDIELRIWRNGAYVLKTGRGREVKIEANALPEIREITGPWEIRFAPGWGAPASKVFPNLISWTQDSDDGVKYFSGIATYYKEFDMAAGQLAAETEIFLDLGRVRFVADVHLNGKNLGILWKPPFRVNVTEAVRPGKNKLVVEVANTWSNRLTGDANSSASERYCRTNITKSLTWEVPWKDTPLLESGLLGPVRLVTARRMYVELPD